MNYDQGNNYTRKVIKGYRFMNFQTDICFSYNLDTISTRNINLRVIIRL